MKHPDDKFWLEFEERDRKQNPAAWALHDHMTAELGRRPELPKEKRQTSKGFTMYLVVLAFGLLTAFAFIIAQ
jgi:hypothetical protein